MFRDKYKDEEYFGKRLNFNSKTFERREGQDHRERVLPQYINRYYLSQSSYSEKLLRINYSLGNSLDSIWLFRKAIDY